LPTDENINFSEDYTLDNSSTFNDEYIFNRCYPVGPVVLGTPGFAGNLFGRRLQDSGYYVNVTVTTGLTHTADCCQGLILVKTGNPSFSMTLPSASSCAKGKTIIIKDSLGLSSTYPINIAADGSDTIDGYASIQVDNSYGSIWLAPAASNKWVILMKV
jgi:hypothetical protein